MYLFIYLWLCWVFVSVRGLSPVAASRGHSSSRCASLSLSRRLLLRSTGSRRAGSVIVAQGPSCSAACGIFPDQGMNLIFFYSCCFFCLLVLVSVCILELYLSCLILGYLLMLKECSTGTSLVAQWLRILLPVQGTQVRALVREEPTCRRATKRVRHNY